MIETKELNVALLPKMEEEKVKEWFHYYKWRRQKAENEYEFYKAMQKQVGVRMNELYRQKRLAKLKLDEE